MLSAVWWKGGISQSGCIDADDDSKMRSQIQMIISIEMVSKEIIEIFQFSYVQKRSGDGASLYIMGVLVVDEGTSRQVRAKGFFWLLL